MIAEARSRLAIVVTLILLVGTWGGGDSWVGGSEASAELSRSSSCALGAPAEPSISLIESPTPNCYRPELRSNTCLINWSTISVSADPSHSVISLTVTIDGQMRANYQGFFQSSMHISSNFQGDGFEVPCGPAGVDGIANMGHQYDWLLSARDSSGSDTSSQGTVVCPAMDPATIFLPLVLRQ